MPEVGTDELRAKFSISPQISEDRLQFCLDSSIRDVKRKIGIEAYGEIFAGDTSTIEDSEYLDENVTTTDEDAMRTGEVTGAVLCYAMANVIVNCNLRIRPSGQVKKEHDAASPAAGSIEIINEYLSPTEALAWKAELVAEGDRSIAAYVIEQAPVNPWGVGKLVRA